MVNQRNSVGVGIKWGDCGRGLELDGDAHWVGEGSDGRVVINTGGVEGVEEVNEPVVYEFFQVEDKLTNCVVGISLG